MGCTSSSFHGEGCGFDDKYILGDRLGKGGFGLVRAVQLRNSCRSGTHQEPHDCAVKILYLRNPERRKQGYNRFSKPDPKLKKRAKRELAAWTMVNGCEHCVQLIEFFKESVFYFLVMEQCRCSVLDELEQLTHVSEVDISRVFRDMLSGISYCHKIGLVHRDIKPANFLLGGPDGDKVKLCDFGLSVKIPQKGVLTGVCGTAPYVAPEMLQVPGYLNSVDVWSLGVTAYLILFGDFPYLPREGERFEDAILNGTPEPNFKRSGCVHQPSQQAVSFVHQLLTRSVRQRLTAWMALQHPFIRELGKGSTEVEKCESSTSLKQTIGKARQRTQEFEFPVDPTRQRAIDEIMEQLRRTRSESKVRCSATGKSMVRHFSFSDSFTGPIGDLRDADEISSQRLSKSSTHCGSMSLHTADFWDDLDLPSTSSGNSSRSKLGQIEGETPDSLSECSWSELPNAIS